MDNDESSISIDSRSDFQDRVRTSLAEAAQAGCRELWLSDTDFASWPLGERAVIDSLAHWAQSHRRLTLMAENFDAIVRLHPRWVDWRRQWAHVVHCCTNTELEPGQVPTLILAPGLFSLRLIDPPRYRGRLTRKASEMVRDRELLDAVLQHSSEAFPATVTGL